MSKILYNTIGEVLRRKAIGRSTLYAEIQRGVFPKPVKLGARKVGWPQHEVDQMMLLYLRSPIEHECREFVMKLHNDRMNMEVYDAV